MVGNNKIPFASVIIPAFNAEHFIADCLNSVFEQQAEFDFEVIVIDDGSSDNTVEIVLKKFPQVRLLQKENGGPGSARNLGAKDARSDILVFIDADDKMLDSRLQYQIGYMLAHPEVKLTFGSQLCQLSPEYNSNLVNDLGKGDEFNIVDSAYQRLIAGGNYIANTTTAVRRHSYLEAGGQPEDILVGEDYAMCCAIGRKYQVAASNRFLTWYRQEDHGNLMKSTHTYIGPARVLLKELSAYSGLLSLYEFDLAVKRLGRLVNMLMGYMWINHGRRAALLELDNYKDLLPDNFCLKWRLLTTLPSCLPAWLRKMKHRSWVSHR